MQNIGIRFFIFFLSANSICSNVFCQNTLNIDSLENVIVKAEAQKTELPEEELVHIYIKLANHYNERKINLSEQYVTKAMSLSRKINFEEGMAHAQGMKGSLLKSQGEYDSAIVYYQKSLDYFELVGDTAYIAKMYNNIGLSYDFKGELEIAVAHYMKSLKAKQQLKDTMGIITCLNNIGASFYFLEKYDEALKYYKMCIPLEKEIDDFEGLAMSYLNIGETYRKLGDYKHALELLLQADEINKTVKNNYLQAMIYDNIGLTYMELGENEKAVQYFDKSIEVNLILNDNEALLNNYTAIGSFHHKNGNLPQAVNYYTKAYEIANKAGFIKPVSDVAKQLSEIYQEQNNFKKALYFNRIYSNLRDSVISIESNKLINEMRIKYESEQKDNEIKLLNKEKEIADIKIRDSQKQKALYIAGAGILLLALILVFVLYHIKKRTGKLLEQKNAQLRVLNFTKDKFISILAHDLKNPFSGFVRITRALNENFNSIPEDKKKQYINTLSESARSLNDLLQNMLQWAVIQNKPTQAAGTEINVSELLNQVITLLSDFAKQNNTLIHNRISDDLKLLADKTYLTIIFNNLLTNAVKFSDGKNTVTVSARCSGEFAEISVSDEGVGMKKKDIEKLFKLDEDPKSIGNHLKKGTGMGLILCKEMAEKMNGTLRAESEVGKGSVFTLTLPLPQKK
jgi:signal transduction histidine kinase